MFMTPQDRIEDLLTITPMDLIRRMKDEGEDWREMVETLHDTSTDREWTGDRFRVIHEDYIDEIMAEELANDDYILGCFAAGFLARLLDCPMEVIKTMQEAEKYDVIGRWIQENNLVEDLAEEYARIDGYGLHFAHYDGHEEMVGNWYVFRIN